MSTASKFVVALLVVVLAAVGTAWYMFPELDSKNFEGSILSWHPQEIKDSDYPKEMRILVKLDDGREVTVVTERRTTAKAGERIPVQEVFGWFGMRHYIELPPI